MSHILLSFKIILHGHYLSCEFVEFVLEYSENCFGDREEYFTKPSHMTCKMYVSIGQLIRYKSTKFLGVLI